MTAPQVDTQVEAVNAFKDMDAEQREIAMFEKLVFLEAFVLKTMEFMEAASKNPMLKAMIPSGIIQG